MKLELIVAEIEALYLVIEVVLNEPPLRGSNRREIGLKTLQYWKKWQKRTTSPPKKSPNQMVEELLNLKPTNVCS